MGEWLKVLLLYPPGWTLVTGSSHLALPLLKSYLQSNGLDVSVRDLNWDAAKRQGVELHKTSARKSCLAGSLSQMNEPYFSVEDRLMNVAGRYGAQWNAQFGFEYEESPQNSSRLAFAAIDRTSPFDTLFDEVVGDISRQQAAVIGFCLASTCQIIPTLQLCTRIRESGFPGFIVLGGNTVSRLSREMAIPAMFDLVDALVTFQGELPLFRLCQAIERGDSLDSVPQLIWRDGDDIRWNTHNENLDPDSVPTPDYRGLPVGQYWGENYVNLVAARGCYYGKCNFCAIPYGWGNGGYSGARSVDRVYEDILVLMERHDINRFKFVDEALSPKFIRALASRILRDGVNVEWEGYTRLEPAWHDPAFMEIVGKAGFRKGYFGLELLPSSKRNALNKRDCARPKLLLDACRAGGVKAHLFCMFGYPGTGEEDAKRTVEFLLENRELIDTADIFPWTYAKHTSVPKVQPTLDPDRDWSLEFNHVGTDPDVLSSAEVTELASRYEEILWDEAPRLLHPTYRFISPWSESKGVQPQRPALSPASAYA